jgi:choline dehydrogenase
LLSETNQKLNVEAFKTARALFNTTALNPIIRGPELVPGEAVQSDEGILDFIRGNTGTLYRASCTCAMGRPNDTMAVIDSKARVIGVSGLRVVDATGYCLRGILQVLFVGRRLS